ncbi:MAG: DUF4493 domain-containing protein [Muribaculaceae bacterium]|nr:DUF4493 domain-containing protein [Muribaculaceae bacterium]
MKTKYTVGLLSCMMLLSSCEELGFQLSTEQGAGTFSKQSILLDVRDDAQTIQNAHTRAGSELDDFKIIFFRNNSETPEASYIYSEMPDVIVLPVGLYSVTATKGVDVEAAWESPYFLGKSDAFQIRKDSITSDLEPIICRMQNVKVSVEFDPMLTAKMTPDSYVEVKVEDNPGLKFTKDTEGQAGHFKHSEGVSLVATFNGVVEGATTVETKSFEAVKKGYHYKIKFKLHSQDSDQTGQTGAEVNVDASVTPINLDTYEVEIGEDEDLGDNERPKEGDDNPDVPTPPVQGSDPVITVDSPSGLVLDHEYVVTDSDVENGIKLSVSSNPGIFEFTVDIISPSLTPEELESFGLSDHLDLVNPGDMAGVLSGFGFPVNIGGEESATFSISPILMGMLQGVGAGNTHTFRLTVSNADDKTGTNKRTVVKNLILKL